MDKITPTADMSPQAIRRRLIEVSQLYELGKKIKKAKKITPPPAKKKFPPSQG